MIPNDFDSAIDTVLRMEAGVKTRESAEMVVVAVSQVLRWSPLGDNHHNAALCPYCLPEINKPAREKLAKLRRKNEEVGTGDQRIVNAVRLIEGTGVFANEGNP